MLTRHRNRGRECLISLVSLGAFAPIGIVVTVLMAGSTLAAAGGLPLNDLGPGKYKDHTGGLYPNGSNARPSAHEAAGVELATKQVQPLDAAGKRDTAGGKIVMISVGMSHTTQVFATKGSMSFKPRADADPAKNPQLVIVDGARGGQSAAEWSSPTARNWDGLDERLAKAGVTARQVQVAWVLETEKHPASLGFPGYPQKLQADWEAINRNLALRYPNIRIAFCSSRPYSYTQDPKALHPEPCSFESAFGVKWMIEKQIQGAPDLQQRVKEGKVAAPWLSWGPYLWCDGAKPRSDGLTWLREDVERDLIHPSPAGAAKEAAQLLAFCKTDPTAAPWFLRKTPAEKAPPLQLSASPTAGVAPLRVKFTAAAASPGQGSVEYAWNFGDGCCTLARNPSKVFPVPGMYHVYVTATDPVGNTATVAAKIVVGNP